MYAPDLITAVADHHKVDASDPAPVPWWSFGKTVLAAAALVLVEQGRLALDTPGPEGFTLRQLLQHQAGLPDYGPLPAYRELVARHGDPWEFQELLRHADAGQLRYQPGRGWLYSNIGYALVRRIIEATEGAPLTAVLERVLFEPLGIQGVRLALEPLDLVGCWGVPQAYHPGLVYHGMLLGPAASAARLLHAILAEPRFAPMRNPVRVGGLVPGRPWQSAHYGLGLMMGSGLENRWFIGHSGEGPGSVAAVYSHRSGRVAAAFLRRDDVNAVEIAAMCLALSEA